MSEKYSNLIVLGTIAFDEIMVFPGQFVDHIRTDKLHQINVSFLLDHIERQKGGTGTNISYNFRLLSDNKVTLLGAVGKDGKEFLDFFRKKKIDTSGIIISKKKLTATGKAITDKSDNQIWGFYYGPSGRATQLDLSDFADSASIFIISSPGKKATLHFQKQAITNKIDYMYDIGMSLTWIEKKDLVKGVQNCRWLIGNDYEIAQVLTKTGFSKQALLKKGIDIITTQGEKGVLYEAKERKYQVPGYKLKRIVDPTGAGDAWRGGFLAGIIDGLKIKDALVRANVLASFAVEKYGTIRHKPTTEQIAKRVKKIEKDLSRYQEDHGFTRG